ncbi:MAG: sulfate adenylyltransferase, partial [Dysgonamonadaceae bacterium]|jgi:sulfate adenylyltransferase subunit 1|nr:sulfate adenylyltransferase [Dysgonamonadaceae bacterium]
VRFPVQYVIRPQKDEFHDYRAYAGRIASGVVRVGDRVTILPSFTESAIRSIDEAGETLTEASAPQSVAIRLEDNVDVSRGDMIVKSSDLPRLNANISVLVCWLNHRPLSIGAKYIIRHTTDEIFGIIRDVYFKVDINTLGNVIDDKKVGMNDIAHIALKTSRPLKYDYYSENRITGSLVIIDESTFETVGAGMIVESLEDRSFAI